MKKLVLLTILLALVTCFPVLAAEKISPELLTEFAATAKDGANQAYSVLILVKDTDRSTMEKPQKRNELLRLLQTRAAVLQKGIIKQLEKVSRSDTPVPVRYKPYWIVNAIALTADQKTITGLAGNPAVEKIIKDQVIPVPVTRPGEVLKSSSGYEWSLEKMRVPELVEKYGLDGSGTVIGQLDTGVDATHPDLAGKILLWKDFTDEPSETPVDENGHGTHTAGTIAGGNASGKYIGVAPGAKLVIARVFASGSTTTSILLSGMEWIADPDGDPETDDAPDACCNSWGGGDSEERREIYQQAIQTWLDAGVIPVFANGNSGPFGRTTSLPGGFLEVIAVGATSKRNRIAYFSSRGPIKWDDVDRIKPDVSAPGAGVKSAKPGGGYQSMSGTSMACPNVTGVVALMKQAAPTLTTEFASRVLQETSLDRGAEGKDNKYGAGIVDALRAVEKLKEIIRLTK